MRPGHRKRDAALLIAAALAYAASAHAAIRTGSAEQGELFLNVVSAAGSATFDMSAPSIIRNPPGLAISTDPVIADFGVGAMSQAGIRLEWDLSGKDAWALFVAASGPALTGVKYDIKALGSRDGFAGVTYLTTSSSPEATVRTQQFPQLQNFDQVGSEFVAETNVQPGQGPDNGANFASSSNPSMAKAYHEAVVGDAWKTFFVGTSTGALGTDLAFYQLSGNIFGEMTVDRYGGVWNLAPTGVLSYTTPVPEPGTWALLAGGLMALGVVARRRRGAR